MLPVSSAHRNGLHVRLEHGPLWFCCLGHINQVVLSLWFLLHFDWDSSAGLTLGDGGLAGGIGFILGGVGGCGGVGATPGFPGIPFVPPPGNFLVSAIIMFLCGPCALLWLYYNINLHHHQTHQSGRPDPNRPNLIGIRDRAIIAVCPIRSPGSKPPSAWTWGTITRRGSGGGSGSTRKAASGTTCRPITRRRNTWTRTSKRRGSRTRRTLPFSGRPSERPRTLARRG